MSGNVTSDPPAEPALRVDTREELVYLLGQACEIEHGLMCEYLYAQFSLKRGPDEGLTDGQLARVQAWEKALISVIKQEMLHLALATNILTAIGAAPHFERPNFPILSRWYPPRVQIALEQACAALSQRAGLSTLVPLAEKLQSMSQDIAAHASRTASRRQHAVPDRREP
jgi:Ferritin-like